MNEKEMIKDWLSQYPSFSVIVDNRTDKQMHFFSQFYQATAFAKREYHLEQDDSMTIFDLERALKAFNQKLRKSLTYLKEDPVVLYAKVLNDKKQRKGNQLWHLFCMAELVSDGEHDGFAGSVFPDDASVIAKFNKEQVCGRDDWKSIDEIQEALLGTDSGMRSEYALILDTVYPMSSIDEIGDDDWVWNEDLGFASQKKDRTYFLEHEGKQPE